MNKRRGVTGIMLCALAGSLMSSCGTGSSDCLPTVAYTHSIGKERQDIKIISGCGKKYRTLTPPAGDSYSYPSVSADGKSVVFISTLADEPVSNGPPYEVFKGDISSGAVSQVTHFDGEASSPALSPDNKTVTFDWAYLPDSGAAPGTIQVGIQHLSLDGAQLPISNSDKLVRFSSMEGDSDWSPDGKAVATSYTRMDASHIAIFDSRTWKQETAFDLDREVGQITYSPDGKYVLLVILPGRSKPPQVYARDVTTGITKQVTKFPNGVAGVSMANDWSLLYIDEPPGDGANGSLHRYDIRKHRDTVIVKSGVYGDISVARTGPVKKHPETF